MKRILCLFFFAINMLGCVKPDQNYYAQFLLGCDKLVYPLTAQCVSTLRSLIPWDDSYNNNPNEQLRLINAFGFLAITPMEAPGPEEKIFRVLPAAEFMGEDFLTLFHSSLPPQGQLFNDILNGTGSFKIVDSNWGAPGSGGYNDGINIVWIVVSNNFKSDKDPQQAYSHYLNQITNASNDARSLVHEYRHFATGGHDIMCLFLNWDTAECDKGTTKPHGWEVSYLHSTLSALRKVALKNEATYNQQMTDWGIAGLNSLCQEFPYIQGLPYDWRGLDQINCSQADEIFMLWENLPQPPFLNPVN